jgi:hypothetical protein
MYRLAIFAAYGIDGAHPRSEFGLTPGLAY